MKMSQRFVAVVAMGFVGLAPVLAHGPAEWIQRGAYKNAIGELCCGERDCTGLTHEEVKITSAGYFIVSIKETVPFDEAAPTPSDAPQPYWRCYWGGRRKCFFAPPGSVWLEIQIRWAILIDMIEQAFS